MKSEITEQTPGEQPQQGGALGLSPDPRALNAVRHGLGALSVPAAEREGYAAHVEAVRTSTGASTYLERCLADRAALALWRLDRVARYEAAQASSAQRAVLASIAGGEEYGPGSVAGNAWAALGALLAEPPMSFRANPAEVKLRAAEIEAFAGRLDQLAAGGGAAGLSAAEAAEVGEAVGRVLLDLRMSPARMVRAMTGRAPRRGEAASVEDGGWEYEPDEVPGLLTLARERGGTYLPIILRGLAEQQRRKASRARELHREALAAEQDALDRAALPEGKALDRVTRYEAHLERVLYRALHDLEASRRERRGEQTPAPLRGVVTLTAEE